MFRVIITRDASKQLEKLPKQHQRRVVARLSALAENPNIGKKLDGQLAGRCSLRVWPYRIIYRVIKDQLLVEVVDVAHRQGVYK